MSTHFLIYMYIPHCYFQASLQVLDESTAQLWWAGKELQRGKKLQDFIGKNEKTKLIVKLQKVRKKNVLDVLSSTFRLYKQLAREWPIILHRLVYIVSVAWSNWENWENLNSLWVGYLFKAPRLFHSILVGCHYMDCHCPAILSGNTVKKSVVLRT